VSSKGIPSPFQILLVTEDAVSWISVEQSAEALVVAAVPQDVESDPALTLIVGVFGVRLIEEQLKFRCRQAENAFVVELLLFLILS